MGKLQMVGRSRTSPIPDLVALLIVVIIRV